MTPDFHHIHIIGRYGQGQHTLMTSRSQGQSQGHEGRCHILPILYVFANSSYSFDRKVLKTHRNVLSDHRKNLQEAEFWIFALKVRYWPFKVKLGKWPKTTLMTPDHHHIHMVGRYRQGQHADMTSRSQGQSQGHQGHFRFWTFYWLDDPRSSPYSYGR